MSFLIKIAEIFKVSIGKIIGENVTRFYENQQDELWKIYSQLDGINKETLFVIGRRLCETQEENGSSR